MNEYDAVMRHYAGRSARRSGVPYMRHIDEGLALLAEFGATDDVLRAWCLHPLVQADADLAAFDPAAASTPLALMYAMEYRGAANAYLPSHRGLPGRAPRPSPVAAVNLMLAADKIQNRRDFERHHLDTHPRAADLLAYFQAWLAALGVSEETYLRLAAGLEPDEAPAAP